MGASDRYYKVAKFPTRNIKTPIVLLYGGGDSLVDINVMRRELPKHTVAKEVPHFEHLDFLWADHVETLVFPHVFDALEEYSGRDHLKENEIAFRSVRNGRFAETRAFSNSEDDISSFTTGEASDLSPHATGNLIKKRDTTARKNAGRVLHTGIPRSKERKSFSSTNPTSLSYGTDEVETPRSNRSGSESYTHNEHQRNSSLSSTKSLDIATRGISVGASKAVVGGVNSPNLRRSNDRDTIDSPKQ